MSFVTRCWRRRGWKLGLASWLVGGAIASANCAFAQITPDSTLPNNSRVNPVGSTSIIEGGTRAGSNLFHSFEQFWVPTGSTAHFNNALDIQNIISRVTGKSISNIDGLIKANGTANLFLINPNGIIFGPNASLNIGGSFVATTANAIQFGQSGFFSADNPNTPALLTVNPSALLFNQIAAAPIQNNSVAPAGVSPSGIPVLGLRVPDGRSLLLIGGNINMDGGRLNAFGGRVELGGLAGEGTLGLFVEGNNLSLSFPDTIARSDVSVANGSRIQVVASNGGSIAINARNIDISGGSFLSAGIAPDLGTASSQAGDITLNATEAIRVKQSSAIVNIVFPDATGNSGNLILTTGSLFVVNGSELQAVTNGQGNAGSLIINASDRVSFDRGDAFSSVEKTGRGKGGDIHITTGELSLTNSAQLNASTYGLGDAGSVIINARERVSLDGEMTVAGSSVERTGIGKGGNIRVTTRDLSLTNSAQLQAVTNGQGNAGDIIIDARNHVSLDGTISEGSFSSSAFSSVDLNGRGQGGDIRITTETLSLTNGAQLIASTFGQGSAGNIIINARERVSLVGTSSDGGLNSAAISRVENTGIGKGGDISISTRTLSLTNGAQLLANTRGQGDAGNVIINALDTVLQGVGKNGFSSLITTYTLSEVGVGGEIKVNTASFRVADGAIVDADTYSSRSGGSVTINANTFEATNGGQVTTITRSSGQAGKITLNVTKSVTLSGIDPTYADRFARFEVVANVGAESGLFASTTPEVEGSGGDIVVNSNELTVQDNARIAVNSQGTGVGGNIGIQAGNLTLKNQALISAETFSSQGGNIEIGLKDILLLRQNSRISTNAGTQGAGGDGGNITINAPNGFIVAVADENSDITANAFTGSGGRVQINAFSVYGTQFREKENPQTSDITASSTFGASGTVELNTPDIDPTQGLVNLPVIPVDTQLAQGCYSGGTQAQSEFIITGRGGLPPNPGEALSTDAVQVDLVTLNPEVDGRSTTAVSTIPTSPTPPPIVEATGWVIDFDGNVVLTANASTPTPHGSMQTPTKCSAPKPSS